MPCTLMPHTAVPQRALGEGGAAARGEGVPDLAEMRAWPAPYRLWEWGVGHHTVPSGEQIINVHKG